MTGGRDGHVFIQKRAVVFNMHTLEAARCVACGWPPALADYKGGTVIRHHAPSARWRRIEGAHPLMTRTAYLIDPWTCTVERVERTAVDAPSQLREMRALMHCGYIQAVHLVNAGSDVMYLDEDGYQKDAQAFFHCRLWPNQTVAGRALWVGKTPDGDDASPSMSLDYVRGHVKWGVWRRDRDPIRSLFPVSSISMRPLIRTYGWRLAAR